MRVRTTAETVALDRDSRPRLGFLGVGWIGLSRMQALSESGLARIAAVADPEHECLRAASEAAPGARPCQQLNELLEQPLDGLVIATPSALHAEQSVAALERGLAVFCQKPLARTSSEAARVIDAARGADRLLGVDLSYRYTDAMQRIRTLVERGALGNLYAADLVFHNAYGPDKPWFYDKASSGGGCVMDLGIHLVDLALWLTDYAAVRRVESRVFSGGKAIAADAEVVEDYATVQVDLAQGTSVRIACSWGLPAGRDAIIEARFYGSGGGAALRNVDGSFFDFVAERYHGTQTETLCQPPDAWGGRALTDWARKLAAGRGFDPEIERQRQVHEVLDAVYARRGGAP